MNPQSQNRVNDKIKSFLNHWIKEGQVIQPSWQFLARSELIEIIQFAYFLGKEDEHEKNTLKKENTSQK